MELIIEIPKKYEKWADAVRNGDSLVKESESPTIFELISWIMRAKEVEDKE